VEYVNPALDNCTNFGYFCKKPLIMSKNTSVTLGNHFEDFVQSRISAGRYKNASEVIRAGLRLLEKEEDKVVALKQAIQEGIDSGFVEDFDPEQYLQSLKDQRSSNG
jgi:antitoxin ParD1/3/4